MTDAVSLPDPTPEELQDRHNALVERQQGYRMSTVPDVYKSPHERLACELALGMEEPDAIFQRYGFTAEAALKLASTPSFAATVNRISQELKTSGLSFKTKARAQAEELLAHSFEMATDPDTAASVRADLIKWTAKVAGLEPVAGKEDNKGGGGLNLTITFAGQAPQQVVHNEPLTIEPGVE